MTLTLTWPGDKALIQEYAQSNSRNLSNEMDCFGPHKMDLLELNWEWDRALKSVFDFFALGNNWDFDGAIAPEPDAIQTALDFLEHQKAVNVCPPNYVAALPSGGIVLEWTESAERTEIEIHHAGLLEILRSRKGRPTIYEEQTWETPIRGAR